MYISYSDIKYYKKFDEVAKDTLSILAKLDKTKSFFISHIDQDTLTILHVFLQNGIHLVEGESVPLEDAY
jgi:hypothetical protein